jgi:hypothetical protein
MAGINGVVGTQNFTTKTVVTDAHPAVIKSVEMLADNGAFEAGTIMAKNGADKCVAFDPVAVDGTQNPIGVLVNDIDTAVDTIGDIVVHGTVLRKALMTGSTVSTDAEAATLESNLDIWTY